MDSFSLELRNGSKVTGLINLPAPTPATPKHCPLLVCLHGGTYSSSYFDAPGQSIQSVSNALGVPAIAIDRAGYGGSSTINTNGAIPDGSLYQEEEGKWLYDQVFPALWEKYAVPRQLKCLVPLTHSMGVPPAIVATAKQVGEVREGRGYIVGGLIMSGWGFTPPSLPPDQAAEPVSRPSRFTFPDEAKDMIMLGNEKDNLSDPKVFTLHATLGNDSPFDEIDHGRRLWFNKSDNYTHQVTVPVLHEIGQFDALWPPAQQEPGACALAFSKSPKVDSGILPNGPHCLELSYQGMAWYVRAFGFAMECAGALGA